MRVTKVQLCEIVGRDERTLSRWQNSGMPVLELGLGRGNENEYDTVAVIEWLVQVAQQRGEKESTRDRLDRIRANREELAFAKDLEEVVVAADLIERFEAMITAAKVELLNTLPDNLASELSARYGVEVDDQLIREPIEAILRKMADYDPDDDAPSDGDSDEPDDPEAAAQDRD
ncbi:terminase small subunit [Azotobacter beijerinckii]|uniref:Phage DNA packaging protein, Nu1 subunit of terminase n=1 Tax=Azotobacter beijerinckii TaxID=170623 RepID=A0A1I3ZPM1_9GAMM|nr:terminase small subunit [Azotobacter beijerinckii]SFK45499.1 Phage DNA packaging protein, Nu1 subunit of terminase [Azotobacter beijerinckii]